MKKVLTTITIAVIISIASTYYTISKYDRNKEIKEKEKIELLALSEEIEEVICNQIGVFKITCADSPDEEFEVTYFKKISMLKPQPFKDEDSMYNSEITHFVIFHYYIKIDNANNPSENRVIVFLKKESDGYKVIEQPFK